jgi:hypothetical protein
MCSIYWELRINLEDQNGLQAKREEKKRKKKEKKKA